MALIDVYRDTVSDFANRVALVRTDQWHEATPCAEWDVHALVNHVVSEERWSVPLFAGATLAEVGDRFDGDLLGDDAIRSAGEAAEDARAAVSETGALERTIHLSIGDTPAVEYIHQLFADHLVHGWDLAVATGTDRTLDPAAAQLCFDWFTEREELYRGAGIIGPALRLPAGAPVADRLLAAFGRNPAAPRHST